MKAFINYLWIPTIAFLGCSDNGESYKLKLPDGDTLSQYGYEVEFKFFKDSTFTLVARHDKSFDSMFRSGTWNGALKEDSLLFLIPKNGGVQIYLRIKDGKVIKED